MIIIIIINCEDGVDVLMSTLYHPRRKANQSMMFRLLGALIRENLFPRDCQISKQRTAVDRTKFTEHQKWICVQQKQTGHQLWIPVQHEGAFKQFQLLSPILFQTGNDQREVEDIFQLIPLLRESFGVDIPSALENELSNSFDYLVIGYRKQREQYNVLQQRFLQRSIHETNYISALTMLKKKESFDEYLFSEAMAVEGNPLHPCAKMRMGMSDAPVSPKYLPESCQSIPIHVLLVPKKHVHITSSLQEDVNQLLFRLSPELEKVAIRSCQEQGVLLEESCLFFVHPWQYEHLVQQHYPIEEWVKLPTSLSGRSLLSLRTIDLIDLGIHLKLPVHIQMTNAVRTLSPQATINGPILSRVCNQLLRAHLEYRDRMVILSELVGVHFRKGAEHDSFFSSNLSYTIREHPRDFIDQGELAFVGAALLEKGPWGRPLILDLMKHAFEGQKLTLQHAIDYIEHYAKRCLPPFLYLLQRYGIALEGHMQNVIVVTRKGYIQRILVRDMGGIRVYRGRFEQQETGHLLEEGPVMVDEMQEVYNKFLHSVLQNHLGALIFVISSYLQITEGPLWERVAQVVKESLDSTSPYFMEDQQALFESMIETKSLLAMRQRNRSAHDYLYIDLVNPLACRSDQNERHQ